MGADVLEIANCRVQNANCFRAMLKAKKPERQTNNLSKNFLTLWKKASTAFEIKTGRHPAKEKASSFRFFLSLLKEDAIECISEFKRSTRRLSRNIFWISFTAKKVFSGWLFLSRQSRLLKSEFIVGKNFNWHDWFEKEKTSFLFKPLLSAHMTAADNKTVLKNKKGSFSFIINYTFGNPAILSFDSAAGLGPVALRPPVSRSVPLSSDF